MVEANSHLKLLHASILDIYKVFKHIDMESIVIEYLPYTVIPTLLGSDFWVCGNLWSQNDVIRSWLRLTPTSNWFPHSFKTYIKLLSKLMCCPWAYSSSLTQLYTQYLAQILGVLGHLWSQNDIIRSWLRLTATSNCSLIHITRYIQTVWTNWSAVHGHTVAALHSHTHTSWLGFLGSGSLVESKWCHNVMVEADCHLKWLPSSIFSIYKVFEHIYMLSMGIQ